MVSTLALIRQKFDEMEKCTLDELYDSLADNPKFKLSREQVRHRIRSAVYALKKNNEIIRIGSSTYQKT